MVSAVPFYSKGSTTEEAQPNLSGDGEFTSRSTSTSPQRKSSRKKWSVQDEPRTLLKRLRSQLAEDGCAESQYLMAKVLLECEDENEDNCKQAVFWLTQSSFQGFLTATVELQKCFSSGLGICEENYEIVKKCLSLDQQEKLAKVAGKQLFGSLCQGNEQISLRKLNKKIYDILNEDGNSNGNEDYFNEFKDNDPNMNCNLEERYGGQQLTETSILDAAKAYIEGDVPSIPIKYTYSQSSQFFKKLQTAHLLCLSVLHKPFTSAHFLPYLYIILFSLSLLYFIDNTLLLFSYIIWVIAFVAMLYSATAIIIKQLNTKIFSIWSVVFKNVCSDIDAKLAASRFKQKHLQMYLLYIGSLFIYLSLFPFINSNFITFFFPPLLFTSFLMFAALLRSNFIYHFLSSSLYIISHYSFCHEYISDCLISFIPDIEPFVLNESLSIWWDFNLNFNVGSIFHCLWFVSFIFVSFTLGITGVLYHFLSVTLFHILIMASSSDITLFSYISFGIWLLILFLPYTLYLFNLIFPVFFIGPSLLLWGVGLETCGVITLCLSIILVIGSIYFSRFFILLKLFLILISLAFLTQQQMHTTQMVSALKWEQFQNSCLPNKDTLSALTVRNCKPLEGTVVQWQAVVKQVEVEAVTNLVSDVVSVLPKVIQPFLKCSLGTTAIPCNREHFTTDLEYHQCLLVQYVKGSECSLKNFDYYRFRIIVSMDSTFWKFQKTSDVVLKGGNEFEEVAFGLSLHDRISFIGTLDNNIGTFLPEITISSINCADCMTKSLQASLQPTFNFEKLEESLKSTFNFVFSPTFSV